MCRIIEKSFVNKHRNESLAKKREMDWKIFNILIFQFAIGIVAIPQECNNFIVYRHMQLNDTHIEALDRTDGIRTTYHCQERES